MEVFYNNRFDIIIKIGQYYLFLDGSIRENYNIIIENQQI